MHRGAARLELGDRDLHRSLGDLHPSPRLRGSGDGGAGVGPLGLRAQQLGARDLDLRAGSRERVLGLAQVVQRGVELEPMAGGAAGEQAGDAERAGPGAGRRDPPPLGDQRQHGVHGSML